MTKATAVLAILREHADDRGVVPALDRGALAERLGIGDGALGFHLTELVRYGALKRLDRRAAPGTISRFLITGKGPGRDGTGQVGVPELPKRRFVPDAAIEGDLRKNYGIEVDPKRSIRRVATSHSTAEGEQVAVTLPRIRALEGAMP